MTTKAEHFGQSPDDSPSANPPADSEISAKRLETIMSLGERYHREPILALWAMEKNLTEDDKGAPVTLRLDEETTEEARLVGIIGITESKADQTTEMQAIIARPEKGIHSLVPGLLATDGTAKLHPNYSLQEFKAGVVQIQEIFPPRKPKFSAASPSQ